MRWAGLWLSGVTLTNVDSGSHLPPSENGPAKGVFYRVAGVYLKWPGRVSARGTDRSVAAGRRLARGQAAYSTIVTSGTIARPTHQAKGNPA